MEGLMNTGLCLTCAKILLRKRCYIAYPFSCGKYGPGGRCSTEGKCVKGKKSTEKDNPLIVAVVIRTLIAARKES